MKLKTDLVLKKLILNKALLTLGISLHLVRFALNPTEQRIPRISTRPVCLRSRRRSPSSRVQRRSATPSPFRNIVQRMAPRACDVRTTNSSLLHQNASTWRWNGLLGAHPQRTNQIAIATFALKAGLDGRHHRSIAKNCAIMVASYKIEC